MTTSTARLIEIFDQSAPSSIDPDAFRQIMEPFSIRRWTAVLVPWLIKFRNDALTAETKKINFMDWVAYWWGQSGCSSPSTKGLHGQIQFGHDQY